MEGGEMTEAFCSTRRAKWVKKLVRQALWRERSIKIHFKEIGMRNWLWVVWLRKRSTAGLLWPFCSG